MKSIYPVTFAPAWPNVFLAAVLGVGVLEFTASQAEAVTREWTGALDNVFHTGGNWSPAGTVSPEDDLVIAGGTVESILTLELGASGAGSLTLTAGGVLNSSNGATVGQGISGEGTIMVEGGGTQWNVEGMLYLGWEGSSQLVVSGGGQVTSQDAASIGALASSTANTVSITGEGSLWHAADTLNIGYAGNAAMVVSDGGRLHTESFARIGRSHSSDAFVFLGGDESSWLAAGEVYVGEEGQGTLVVNDKATFFAEQDVYVGLSENGAGQVVVNGDGSEMMVQGDLRVAYHGTGQVGVVNAGRLVTEGQTFIGWSEDSEGLVVIVGEGSQWIAKDVVYIGGLGDALVGEGEARLGDSASMEVQGWLYVMHNGELVLDDSSLQATYATNYGQVEASGSSLTFEYFANVEEVTLEGGTFTAEHLANYEQIVASDDARLEIEELDNDGRLGILNSTLIADELDNYEELVAIGSRLYVNELVNHDEMTLRDTEVYGALGHTTDATIEIQGTVNFHADVYGGGDFLGSGNAVFHGLYRPANSIASPSFTGDFTLASTGTLSLQVSSDPTVHDTITVAGTATFEDGSTLQLVKIGEGPIAPGQQFNLVTANGGIDNQGLVVTSLSPLLSFSGAADGHDFVVTAMLFEDDSIARNRIQRGVFAGFMGDTTAGIEPDSDYWQLLGQLQMHDIQGLSFALEQLSPAALANAAPAHRHAVQAYQASLVSHLRHTHATNLVTPGVSAQALVSSSLNAVSLPAHSTNGPQVGQWTLTGQAYGLFDRVGSGDHRLGYEANTAGGLFAFNYTATPNWRLGLAAGYARTDITQSRNQGDGSIDNVRFGPTLSYDAGPLFIDAGLSYGYSNIKLDRDLTFTGTRQTNRSRHDGHDLATFLSAGYDWQLGHQTTLTPIASLQYLYLHEQSYQETGSGAGRLSVRSRNNHSLNTSLGVRLRHEWFADNIRWAPEVSVAWGHAWLNNRNDIRASFIDGATTFTTSLDDVSGSSLETGAGVSMYFNNHVRAFVQYQGRYHERNAHSHAFGAGLSFQF